jgi:Meiotically up-regulated gene 113
MTGDHLYVIGTGKDGRAKIGRTKRSANQRPRELQTGNPDKLQILAWFDGLGYTGTRLHSYYDPYRVSGEWFDFGGSNPVQIVIVALGWLLQNAK